MPRTKQFDEQVVLEKATELFWKQGFHATSMQDLVDHLGINRASLYATFGGKEQLFERAFEQYRSANLQKMKTFLFAQPSVKAGLKQLLLTNLLRTLDDADKKGCFAVNCTTELLPGDPAILHGLLENRNSFETLMQEYLGMGVAKGEISPSKNLAEVAALLFTLNNGLQVVAKLNPPREELIAVVELGLSVLE